MALRSVRALARSTHHKLAAASQLVDAIIIFTSLWFISWLYGLPWREDYTIAAASAVGLYLFFSHFYGVHQTWHGAPVHRELGRLWLAWLAVVLGLLFLAFALKASAEYSRRIFLTWFVMTPLLLMVWRGWFRILLGALRRHGRSVRRVAIVGAQELGANLARTLLRAPWMGLQPVGFYDDRAPGGSRSLARDPLPIMGNLTTLINHVREDRIDEVFIALPLSAKKRIRNLIVKLADTTASVYIVPDFFIFDLVNARWTNIGDLPVLSVFETPFYGVDGWLKRIEDVIIASVILLIIALPMLAIAVGVKLSSPGPVIFRQRRYGLRGEKIEVWKFRTMTVTEEGGAVVQATKNDPRILPFGAFLRRTSLDELPQFINVLQGRMSIVGPRPHALVHNEQYRKLIHGYMLRHKVKPGITGLAQIRGWRGETEVLHKMEKRVECDLDYIQNWSLWLDLKIILLTVFVGFSSKSAY